MRFAFALLLLLAPVATAECTTPTWSRLCSSLTSPPTSLSSAYSKTEAQNYVEREIVKFTGGSCGIAGSCSETELKGSASTQCWDDALSLLCFHISAPVYTIESSDCAASTAAAPTIADCEAAVTSCAATMTTDKLQFEPKGYCQNYVCDTGNAASCGADQAPPHGACAVPFDDHPARCACAEDQIGTNCAHVRQTCPTSNADYACSGHGVCDQFAGTCSCLLDFEGADCFGVSCQKSGTVDTPCNSHGVCHPVGVCQCDAGWIGAECTINITEEGMTSGEFAGAVIGGLIFGILFCGITVFLWAKGDD